MVYLGFVYLQKSTGLSGCLSLNNYIYILIIIVIIKTSKETKAPCKKMEVLS